MQQAPSVDLYKMMEFAVGPMADRIIESGGYVHQRLVDVLRTDAEQGMPRVRSNEADHLDTVSFNLFSRIVCASMAALEYQMARRGWSVLQEIVGDFLASFSSEWLQDTCDSGRCFCIFAKAAVNISTHSFLLMPK